MEKAIEIKRKAQRCIQNNDLDGALNEYRKLIGSEDSDPYHFVLIADLLFKKGDGTGAAERYLDAATAYEKAGLYKNAIAVCKKMLRLSLSPPQVTQRLGQLHHLDGLGTEAALYFMQYAEHQLREHRYRDAADTMRRAFEACPENLRILEKLSEVLLLDGSEREAAEALLMAAERHEQAGSRDEGARLRSRAATIDAEARLPAPPSTGPTPARPASQAVAPSLVDEGFERTGLAGHAPGETNGASASPAPPSAEFESRAASGPPVLPRAEGLDDGRGPGLRFDSPAVPEAEERANPLIGVEALLRDAEEAYRAGDRDRASATLLDAARAYDGLGRHDSSAAIYRSLSRSAQAPPDVMRLWLRNCELRQDLREAAQVACALGDRALSDGDPGSAREWFERARAFDADNELAARRLQRLDSGQAGAATVATMAGPEVAPPGMPVVTPAEDGEGRVEIAVGRAEAVTLDLGSLISEFQRGVEQQLAGDPQSHYDLGMAYREMGLLEQAVDSFRLAGQTAEFRHRCAEMIGRCMLDQGRFEDAVHEFSLAVEQPGLPAETAASLRFQLGLAHEASGRLEEAVTEFEQVYAAQPSYPDVAQKIKALRRMLESA